MLNICRGISKFKFYVKKQILIIPLIICENDPTIAAVENNPAALSELIAAHHLGTPGLLDSIIDENEFMSNLCKINAEEVFDVKDREFDNYMNNDMDNELFECVWPKCR